MIRVMTKYMHVFTNKNYVLRSIKMRLNSKNNDWKYFSVLVFKNKKSHEAESPESFEELERILKDYDKVYSFYEVQTLRNGEIGYDIILEGEEEE